jgi:cytochrome c
MTIKKIKKGGVAMKMKKVLGVVTIAAMTVVFLSGIVYAQEKMATPAQAKDQVKKMVAYVKQAGAEKALAEFNDPKAAWNTTYKNLYTSGGTWDGVTVFHGKFPMIKGQNHIGAKDAEGKLFVQKAIEDCKKTGSATVEFKWMITDTNKIEPRTMYCEAVDAGSKYVSKIDICITYAGKF